MCPSFRKRLKIIRVNEAYVYVWTLGETEIEEMGHFMPCREHFVGDFGYGISYNGVMCTVFDFFS